MSTSSLPRWIQAPQDGAAAVRCRPTCGYRQQQGRWFRLVSPERLESAPRGIHVTSWPHRSPTHHASPRTTDSPVRIRRDCPERRIRSSGTAGNDPNGGRARFRRLRTRQTAGARRKSARVAQWPMAIRRCGPRFSRWPMAIRSRGPRLSQWLMAIRCRGPRFSQWPIAIHRRGPRFSQWPLAIRLCGFLDGRHRRSGGCRR